MYMIYKLYNIHKNVSKYIYINSIYIYLLTYSREHIQDFLRICKSKSVMVTITMRSGLRSQSRLQSCS